MMKKFVMSLVLVVLCAVSVNASAEKLVVATTEYPPYVIVKDGAITGIYVDIIRELFTRNGFEADFQVVPWQRALSMVEKGAAAVIASPRKTPEREEFLYFPAESFDTERTVIVALKDNGFSVNTLADLEGKRIGIVKGYSYGEDFDNYTGAKKFESYDDSLLIKVLSVKRIDCAMSGDEGVTRYIAREAGIEIETIYMVSEAPNYLAVSKEALGDKGPELAEKISQTLIQLREEGVVESIRANYL